MKKSIYTLMCLFVAMLMCQQSEAQNLVYGADFENDNEGWTAEGDYSGKNGMWEVADGAVHGYAYMATGACQSYFVSPAFTLASSGNQVTFNQQGFYFNDFAQEAKLVIREKGGSWVEIQGIQYPESYEMANSGMLDIPADLNGKEVQLGFFYNLTSTASIGDWYIQEIKVYGGEGGEQEKAAFWFDVEEVSYDMASGEPFESPVLNNPDNIDVKYTSSDANVANVNYINGKVTISGLGTAVITATGNDETASYTINVTDANVVFGATLADDFCGFVEYNEAFGNAWYPEMGAMKADAYEIVEEMTDFYLISPEFTLDKNGNTVSFVHMAMYFDNFAEEAQLVIREVGTEEWINLGYIEEPSAGMGFCPSGELIIPKELNGKNVQIAFKYSSGGTDYDSGIWYVKNIYVKRVVPTGIDSVTEKNMNDGKIYDIQGRRLNKLQKGINIVNGKKIIVK